MPRTPPIPPEPHAEPRAPSFWRRLGWFVLIWALSVAALGAVALMLRWWLR